MPTPIQYPDGNLDHTHTWQNASDRVSAERSFVLDPVEQGKIQQALATADPAMPNLVIQMNMTSGTTVVIDPTEPLTVAQCFTRDLGHVNDYAPTNFSGKLSEFQGSSIPSMPPF
jgi:hypothetical protein